MSKAAPSAGAKRLGFTLIELLMALTILAILAGGMTMAFSTSLTAAGTIRKRTERSDVRRAVVARLKTDLQGSWVRPGSETTWFRGIDAANAGSVTTSSQGDVLDLTTARLVSPEVRDEDPTAEPPVRPQSDVAQVSWQLEPDASGDLALVRRERTPPDPEVEITQDPAVVPTVIARGITDLNVRYFDGTDWLDEWDTGAAGTAGEETETADVPTAGLPRAVEVTLFLGDGTGRRGMGSTGRAVEDELRITLVVALPGEETVGLTATGETTPEGEAP